jgi:hypothetical protein
MFKRAVAFVSLFASVGTLLCCALPALFVLLGLGATFAGLVGTFPQLVWISERKVSLFVLGAILLTIGGALQWRARNLACPTDPELAAKCRTTRDWSFWVYLTSLGLYLVGAAFAFGPTLLH